MANEHVLLEEYDIPTSFTCADGTGIEKGTLVQLDDPDTIVAHNAINEEIVGVTAEEKIASDGHTKIAVYDSGKFKATASGAITAGDSLCASETANILYTAPVNAEKIVGRSMETVADGETFKYKLEPKRLNLA